MSERQHWIPLESNPEAMAKFLSNIGVPDEWSVVDVIGLDEELLQFMETPVLSLILLLPSDVYLKPAAEETATTEATVDYPKDVYFMRQTVGNACGTIALLHSVANNCDRIALKDGSILKTFFDSSKDMTPEERGKLLESNADICKAHHNCAREGQTSTPAADAHTDHHFIALVHKNGFLYGLEGSLNASPVNHGKTSEETFLADAARVCRQYVARDPNNLKFTVMALNRHTQD